MPTSTKLINWIIAIILGGLFTFSAIVKTQPISYFEYVWTSQLNVSSTIAAWGARLVIGLELALGVLLLLRQYGYKRWVLSISILMMLAFTLHLAILYFTLGNDINCGCMGENIEMSPLISILKNIAMLSLLVYLLIYDKGYTHKLIQWIIIPLSMLLVFITQPLGKAIELDFSKLNASYQPEAPVLNFWEGKHIVCFLSLTCGHCKDAAIQIKDMLDENNKLPFYFIFMEPDEEKVKELMYKEFMDATSSYAIPHHFIDKKDFINYVRESGSSGTPTILWMKDSKIIRNSKYHELNIPEIERWLHSEH